MPKPKSSVFVKNKIDRKVKNVRVNGKSNSDSAFQSSTRATQAKLMHR